MAQIPLVKYLTFWKSAAIVLLSFLVFFPSMKGEFISDDEGLISRNPLIVASDGLGRIWFGTETPDYFPLTSTSWWLEWRLWGQNTTGYHLTNILLHALSAVLLWRILLRLEIPCAWVAATAFAIHPVTVESVAWISERKNTLSLFMCLMSIHFWIRSEKSDLRRWRWLSITAFLFSLLSKPSMVMLPVIFLLMSWWRQGRVRSKDVMKTIPFFLLSAVLGIVTLWFQAHRAIGHDVVRHDDFFSRVAVAGKAIWFYAGKTLAPVDLCFVYPRWSLPQSGVWAILPGFLLLAFLIALLMFRKTWARGPLLACGYSFLVLLPVLGFVNISYMKETLVADHWGYSALPGFVALVVTTIGFLIQKICPDKVWVGRSLAAIYLVVLGGLTFQYSAVFKDSETLDRDILAKNPREWSAHYELGLIALERGKENDAIWEFSEALKINPAAKEVHYDLAQCLGRKSDMEGYLLHLQEVIRLDPEHLAARADLAAILVRQQKYDEALRQYFVVMQLVPGAARTYYNLAEILLAAGRVPAALHYYERALAAWPTRPEILERIAWILATSSEASLRNGPRSLLLAQQACQLEAASLGVISLDTLAAACAEVGRFPEAIELAEKALQGAQVRGQLGFLKGISHRLELYRQGQPYHGDGPRMPP